MSTAIFIRHGDKEKGDFFNPQLGHWDQPLSARGQWQAGNLVAYFAGRPLAAIYVSEYQRTGQTIAPVAAALGLSPVVDPRLNEIDNGPIGIMSEAEIQQAYPEVWQAFVARAADFRYPNGETGQEAQQRVLDFLEEKRALHGAETFVAVSHDGLIRLLLCAVVRLPVYQRGNFRADTCGITELTYQPQYSAWKLVRYNQSMDLGRSPAPPPAAARAERTIHQGDLYWAPLAAPGGPEPDYAHPCVVVQEDVLNHSRIDTVVVCALTSNLARANLPGSLLLPAGEANLPRASVVEVSKVSTLAKAQLGEYIGSLSPERVAQILAGLRFVQSLSSNLL